MTSPTVWQDAFDRAIAAATPLGIPVFDALAQNRGDRNGPYILFEIASSTSGRFELGEMLNEEAGQVWLHLGVPRGSGALDAIMHRKQISNAFRVPVTPLPTGLHYDDQAFDPPDLTETGNWALFSLAITYRYQDRVS